jgi:ubiquinone/menaquinone biosynthesis C-methylase UbiE
MKTDWDYTGLAKAYLKRPAYAAEAVDAMLAVAGPDSRVVCDIGAGTANLAHMLAERGRTVVAVEPNQEMRRIGVERTAMLGTVQWVEASGEATGQADGTFDLVTFGSSFNVCDRPQALRESTRILKPNGWIACLWNHRQLDDPVQSRIERLIREQVPGFSHGTRREDQAPVIAASGRFRPVNRIAIGFTHVQSVADCVEAWRSHATLARQSGDRFFEIVQSIEGLLRKYAEDPLRIPYLTVVSMARLA